MVYTKLLLDHHIHYIFEFFIFSGHFSVDLSEFAYQYRVLFVSSDFSRMEIVAESVCRVETSCPKKRTGSNPQTPTSKLIFILDSSECLSLPIKAGTESSSSSLYWTGLFAFYINFLATVYTSHINSTYLILLLGGLYIANRRKVSQQNETTTSPSPSPSPSSVPSAAA